jgi:transcriptional regulator with XRE-family HTH domain
VAVQVKWPEHAEFFTRWFDPLQAAAGLKDSEIARRALMSHSTISGWRSGRQQPTAYRIAAVAAVFDRPATEAWAAAGIRVDADNEVVREHGPVETVERIRAAGLSPALTAILVDQYLDDVLRSRLAVERRLQEKLDLLGAASPAGR